MEVAGSALAVEIIVEAVEFAGAFADLGHVDVLSIKPGAVLFELAGVPARVAKEAFRLADAKLPFHCRFIVREGTVL